MDEALERRFQKLLNMIARGEPGESANAQSQYDKLVAKHGDPLANERSLAHPEGDMFAELARRVVYSVLGECTITSSDESISFTSSSGDFKRITLLYEGYSNDFTLNIGAMASAYFSVNELESMPSKSDSGGREAPNAKVIEDVSNRVNLYARCMTPIYIDLSSIHD